LMLASQLETPTRTERSMNITRDIPVQHEALEVADETEVPVRELTLDELVHVSGAGGFDIGGATKGGGFDIGG
jgi:hypothetical protein